MKQLARFVLAGAGLAVVAGIGVTASAAPAPVLFSVVEGRDAASERPVLVLIGKSLTKLTSYEINDPSGVHANATPEVMLRTKGMVVLAMPADLAAGTYELTCGWSKSSTLTMPIKLGNGAPLPGAVSTASLDASLKSDLDDAGTLGGQAATYYRDASNLDAGTLNPARYSAIDDLVAESRIGSGATQVAAGDHNHDTRYPLRSELTTPGTINSANALVDWTQLRNVPSGFADGVDGDTTFSAGSGLSLAGGSFAVQFGGTGTATTASRSDHDHDTRYFTQSALNTAGTLNLATNPMDWTKLKNVPAGFADGVDSDTTYSAGSGLSLSGTTFSASFGGNGSATTLARSDHNHDSSYYTQSQLNAAGTVNTNSNPVDWSKLKNVPAGFADGTDNDAWTTSSSNVYRSAGRVGVGVTTPAATLHVSGNDGVLFEGTYNSGAIPASGSGTRMMWYPKKAAFRAGTVATTGWDDAAVGAYSVAMGSNPEANGDYSVAIGSGARALGDYGAAFGLGSLAAGNGSFAAGISTEANGYSSAALGYHSHADGDYSFAAGDECVATGFYSFAAGFDCVATGNDSVAMGYTSEAQAGGSVAIGFLASATNSYATSLGYNTTASGSGSLATGVDTTASGTSSAAFGFHATAQAYNSVAFGRYNVIAGNADTYTAGDPVLVVGNGTSTTPSTCFSLTNTGNLTVNASTANTNSIATFQAAGTNKARIDQTGKGFFNGGTQASGADFAESVGVNAAKNSFEPGDVIVIDTGSDRRFALSTTAESTLVAGVYSTKPGLLAMPHDCAGDNVVTEESEIPLAVVGIVPVKVCDEGGPIARGDALVTASVPGYAKKAPKDVKPCTLLGKALGKLEKGKGTLEVLLMAR